MLALAELGGQRSRLVGGAPEADPDAGAGAGEGDRDRPSDPGAGSGDDRAQTGERRLSGLRGQWLAAGSRER
jgi:hypothetical protein